MTIVYIGTSDQTWLREAATPEGIPVAWCISQHRLGVLPPRPRTRFFIDSGAYSELKRHGGWRITAKEYVRQAQWWFLKMGTPDFLGQMDWMTEREILAKTGLSCLEHQRRTVRNYQELEAWWNATIGWDEPHRFAPTLQGDSVERYLRCVDMFQQAGVDLAARPVVGLGSVCRLQSTSLIVDIVTAITEAVPGIKLHGYGVKVGGIRRCGQKFVSTDSQSWSKDALHNPPLPGHTHQHCVSCIDWAFAWYQRLLTSTIRTLAA